MNETEAAERFETWGGGGAHTPTQISQNVLYVVY